jgi:hypothetical protein
MSINEHLTEEQIIQAELDASDLSPQQREHLESCESCRRELANLGDGLMGLSRLAARSVEVPERSFRLPDEASFKIPAKPAPWAALKKWWAEHTALGLGGGLVMAAVMVMAVLIGLRDPRPAAERTFASQEQELEFILAVDKYDEERSEDLLDPPLAQPSPFAEFVMAAGDDEMDDEFMQFLAPDDEGEETGLL